MTSRWLVPHLHVPHLHVANLHEVSRKVAAWIHRPDEAAPLTQAAEEAEAQARALANPSPAGAA